LINYEITFLVLYNQPLAYQLDPTLLSSKPPKQQQQQQQQQEQQQEQHWNLKMSQRMCEVVR